MEKRNYPRKSGSFTDLSVAKDADLQNLAVINDATILDDVLVKGNLTVEGSSSGTTPTEAQDFHIHKDLLVQDDATVKGDLKVEQTIRAEKYEYKEIQVIDSTVQQDLRVGRRLYVEGSSELGDAEIQKAFIHEDLTVQDDATIKNNLQVEGYLRSNSPVKVSGGMTIYGDEGASAQKMTISDDIFIRDDATIKGDLRVDKRFYSHGAVIIGGDNEEIKMTVTDDVIISDDATVKDDIRIEGNCIITGSIEAGSGLGSAAGDEIDPYYYDATVKGNLDVEKNVNIHEDLIVQSDATVKETVITGLIIGKKDSRILDTGDYWHMFPQPGANKQTGLVFSKRNAGGTSAFQSYMSTSASAFIWTFYDTQHLEINSYDVRIKPNDGYGLHVDRFTHMRSAEVYRDLICHRDATINSEIYVDNAGSLEPGITTDFTSGKFRIQVVKGLITNVSEHEGV